MYPEYKLGNILQRPLDDLMDSDQQRKFGNDKQDTLPQYCRQCEVRFACTGDCPKHRFMRTPDGEPGLSYVCPAYKRIFGHMDPYMQVMARLVQAGREAAQVMEYVAEEERQKQLATVGPNDPCPCGSGKKFKKCCGASGIQRFGARGFGIKSALLCSFKS